MKNATLSCFELASTYGDGADECCYSVVRQVHADEFFEAHDLLERNLG